MAARKIQAFSPGDLLQLKRWSTSSNIMIYDKSDCSALDLSNKRPRVNVQNAKDTFLLVDKIIMPEYDEDYDCFVLLYNENKVITSDIHKFKHVKR